MSDAVKLHHGDCIDVMRKMPDNSVDSIVTDPPYGLSFMGKAWDKNVPSVEVWREAIRVLKPGGHLLAFAGTRTQHRMCCAIEDAGFQIRDMIAWVYSNGFPKSHNVSIHIDKAAGAEREFVRVEKRPDAPKGSVSLGREHKISSPATEAAKKWHGWGTALKPALEPITVARKPLAGTVVANVMEHGTGAINIDECRETTGRWPANLIHDGSEEVNKILGDSARFFYASKATKMDRDDGLEKFSSCKSDFSWATGLKYNGDGSPRNPELKSKNNHPTVKPTDLMRYLCRLVTPPGGTILDPFMGSGSTGKAAVLEGFRFTGIEIDRGYLEIARARIDKAMDEIDIFAHAQLDKEQET